MENLEEKIFNYLANNLQLKFEDEKIRLLLRNQNGYFKEIANTKIVEDVMEQIFIAPRNYLSNDD